MFSVLYFPKIGVPMLVAWLNLRCSGRGFGVARFDLRCSGPVEVSVFGLGCSGLCLFVSVSDVDCSKRRPFSGEILFFFVQPTWSPVF